MNAPQANPATSIIDQDTLANKASPIGSLAAAFQFAQQQREFEIGQLTQRNNFFMIFQGVLIAGLIQSQGTAAAVVSFSVCALGFLVSLFQVGMAAGSKFWQVRWERAAKTTEIWLLKALQDQERINNFLTADGKHLTPGEKADMSQVNLNAARQNDQLEFDDGATVDKNRIELCKDDDGYRRAIENFLILKKFSVSRIPIWVGLLLALFWFYLLTFTISIDALAWNPKDWLPWIRLVPFKA